MQRRDALRYRSRLAAFGLQVHDRMAGKFLAFASFGEKAVNVVSVGRRERVFSARQIS